MPNNLRPYVLAETNWKTVKDCDYKVAVLPWGATEAHNYHLPYGTDNFQATYVAEEAARIAWNNQAKTIVLPTIPFGVNTGQMDIDLCMNMRPSTQYAVLRDVVEVLNGQNIDRLVIVNSHGGNHFKQMIRELSLEFPKVFVCSLDWWKVVDANFFFDEPGDHAGELETATMMHIAPRFVLPLEKAGSGKAKRFKIQAFNDGWVSAQRQWTQVSDDTGVGNPKAATSEKGTAFLHAVVQRVAIFLEDLHDADLNDMYA